MLKWMENFWYHHKWAVIITVFFIVVLLVCALQMSSRVQYDFNVIFVGNGGNITGTQYNDILSSLEKVSYDADENGKTSVCFSRETFISDQESELVSNLNSNITSFMQSSLYQDYYVYFIDPVLYENYKNEGVFVPLALHINNINEKILNDELSIRLGDCAFYDYPGISAMPEDTLIVLKTVPFFSSEKKTDDQKQIQSIHADLIENIILLGSRSSEK